MLTSAVQSSSWAVPKILLVLIFFLGICVASPVYAVGNLRLGPLQIDPFASVTFTLDDNVCRNELNLCPDPASAGQTTEGSDLITRFETGVNVKLPLRKHQIDAGYEGRFERYSKFKLENSSDSTVRGGIQLNFNGGLSLEVRDEWISGHDPRGFNQNIELDFFRQNTFEGEASLLIGARMGIKVIYRKFTINHEDDVRNGFRDHTKETMGGQVFLKAFSRTHVFAEFSQAEVSFERPNTVIFPLAAAPNGVFLDSTEDRFGGGLTWDASSYTQGTLKVGYVAKEFVKIKEVLNVEAQGAGGTASAEIKHGFSSLTRAHLSFRYDLEESALETQAYYRKTVGSIEITREIHPRIIFSVRGGYNRDKYPGLDTNLFSATGTAKRRLDNTWESGGGFTYNRFDWLIFGLDYLRVDRKSTIEGFDYSTNRYSVSLRMEL